MSSMALESIDTPTALLPYQQDWLADEARVAVIVKSRRIGISWSEAGDSTIEASSVDGCDVWYIGYNHDMAAEFIRDCAFWARVFGERHDDVQQSIFEDDDPDKHILTYIIRFASGWRITALSSRPTNLRNKKGRIIIDEAAFHPDLKGLLKAAMAVLIWGGKSKVRIISTHNGTECHFHRVIEEIKAGKKKYSLHQVTLDDALSQGLFKRICMVNNMEWSPEAEADWRRSLFEDYGDDANEELLCIPARSGGTYLARPLIERQMREGEVYRLSLTDDFLAEPDATRVRVVQQWCEANLREPLKKWPKDLLCFFGEDFGRVSDRTVIAPGYMTQKLVRVFPWVVELSNVPFEQQRQVLFYLVDRLPSSKMIGGALDATGNGAYLAEQAALKYGLQRVQRIDLSETWYSENLPPFKVGFEDRLIEIVRDADHLIDLTQFKVINGVPKLPRLKTNAANNDGPPRHGDAAIAYVLGYAASRAPIPAYNGYEGSKSLRSKDDEDGMSTAKKPSTYIPRTKPGGLL